MMKKTIVSVCWLFLVAACGEDRPGPAELVDGASCVPAAQAEGEPRPEARELTAEEVSGETVDVRCAERGVTAMEGGDAPASDPKHETTGDPNPI
ncbi:hypothetical protein [Myxococcus sp. RHSTA-1-4]|uniref:hypothetical protein n=1 Tax=Myxococcus sp. RHSTA-1-4 TaxID=2874601 RepID=UPI001CBC283A|nr:hypothetical protein [Myxococcus sp. RHSTA-1-4]MBZ4416881.1 hypothetical protein [Myxococcus sp. RHSTA-1-4]